MATTIRGEHGGLWGVYRTVAALPNTSGADEQSSFLERGHLGIVIVSGTPALYICTTHVEGSGVWAQVVHTGSSVTGGLTLSGTLAAEQVTSTDDATVTDDLAVTGLATVGETMNVGGNFAVNSSKFTVGASSGNVVVAGTLTPVGLATWTAGISTATAISGVHNAQIISATGGTAVAGADGTQYVSSIWLPVNMTITGVQWLIGTGGTDKHYVCLYDADGTLVANSSTATDGAIVGTTATLDVTDFTATYAAIGPAMYYVGVSIKSTTASIRALPAYLGGSCFAGQVSQTHGAAASISPPTTFTADKGPYVILY